MEIFWIFAAMTFFGLTVYFIQIWSVQSYAHTHPPCLGEGDSPSPFFLPISILKPLKGLDDNLFDNLESFCNQDYQHYEIIFSLQDHNDPAFKVARKVKEKYPNRDISIVVERCNAGLNPKVNNLIPAYRASRHECILISDSNVQVDKNYLKEIVRHMEDPNVGLVSNLIKGTGGRTLGSLFENLHQNSFVMGNVSLLDRVLNIPCVIGKSMLMRKTDLEAIGGFQAVRDILAEDYALGEKMHKSGRKVVLSRHMVQNVNEYWGISRFLNRHIRWGKLRWKIGGAVYLLELIGNPVFMSFLPMLLWKLSSTTVSFAILVSFVKAAADFYMGRQSRSTLSSPFSYLLSPVKDLLIGLIWFVPLVSSTVSWRGNRYRIGKNSVLHACPHSGLLSWRCRFADAVKERFA